MPPTLEIGVIVLVRRETNSCEIEIDDVIAFYRLETTKIINLF